MEKPKLKERITKNCFTVRSILNIGGTFIVDSVVYSKLSKREIYEAFLSDGHILNYDDVVQITTKYVPLFEL